MSDVTWMKVTDILQNVTGSCDYLDHDDMESDDDVRTEFWLEMLRTKCNDTGFGHLVESIMRDGFNPEGAITWRKGYIYEGHHRIAAAILLCLDEIPVADEYMELKVYKDRGWPEKMISAHSHNEDPYPLPFE